MSLPGFCAAYGAVLEGKTAAVRILDDRTGDGGYHTSCGVCGWTGGVFPDVEQVKFREENGADPSEPRRRRAP